MGLVLCLLLPAAASAAVQPTLTAAGSNAKVGGNIHVVATLSGGSAATGTIAFKLYGPADGSCVNTPVFTDSANVAGDDEYSSGNFATTQIGTYHWSAEYSGDGGNEPATSLCMATSTVGQATPELTSVAANGTAGGSISDAATVAGGFSAGGQLTFKAFGPSNPSCAGAAAYTNTVPVSGNGPYGSGSLTNALAGSYRWTIEYTGDANNAATTSGCNAANETSSVSKASPTISTVATSGTVGGTIQDTATIAAGVAATGNIVFKAFGPNDTSCSNAAAFTATVPVSGNGGYQSGPFTTSAAGTYRWTAEYSGDANNNGDTSGCNAAEETSTVAKMTTSLLSTATSAAVGAAIKDTATLSGGLNPTGNLVFKAFGPNDTSCSNAAAFTATIPVSGNAAYGSGDFTNTQAGSYRWTIEYTGDANNNATTSPCNSANETSTVGKVTPTLSSNATNGTVGGTIKDTATLGGGASPTGSLVFKAFGPNDTSCANAAAFTKTVTVGGNASYDSTDFTTSAAGAYRWTVEYSGDANNNATTSPCNAANETSTVGKATPTLSSTATNGTVGGTIKDVATLAAGAAPSGNLVFKAFGPNNTTCAGTAAFTKTVTVGGNASYDSTDFTTSAAGAYRWTVEYAGDANNNAATSACNAANETSTVAQVTPTLASIATSGIAGGTIKDTATLSAGFSPTGTLTFSAFGPANATCAGGASFTKVVTVAGNASYDSTNFTNPLAGAYRWTIAYSGDANNAPVSSGCNASEETSTVGKATPTISTLATNGTVGGTIKDTATLGGGASPTGSLVFKAFGPNDTSCANAAAFTATIPVAGNAAYGSGDFTVTLIGDYRWTVEYAGDANNNAAVSGCNAANETSTVGKATPTITSNAASTIFPGSISDTATVAAGFNPTGNLVFKAYGPENATCSGVVAYTKTVPVSGNGAYGSAAFENAPIGTYRWTVEYTGDAGNNLASSNCNAAGGTSFVSKVPPQISVSAGSAAIGGAIASFAKFGGGLSHTGQLVIRAYPPSDSSCSGGAAYAQTVTVTAANPEYASGQFVPAQAGAYRWTATYSGDEKNAAETTACSAAVSSVAPASPSLSAHLAPATITLGQGVGDTATLSGGFKPGGTISFSLYGPGDTSCRSNPALTGTAAVSGDGTYTSPQLVPKKPGDYRFVVRYSGDTSNTAATVACGAGGEFVDVQKKVPTLKGRASVKGKKIVARATLAGAASPTGKVTFRIYAPNDSRCARKPLFVSQAKVKGTVATAAGYLFTRAGLYRFSIAFSGDERNQPVKNACTVRGQSIRVK